MLESCLILSKKRVVFLILQRVNTKGLKPHDPQLNHMHENFFNMGKIRKVV